MSVTVSRWWSGQPWNRTSTTPTFFSALRVYDPGCGRDHCHPPTVPSPVVVVSKVKSRVGTGVVDSRVAIGIDVAFVAHGRVR